MNKPPQPLRWQVALARLYWIMFGPLVLVVAGLAMVMNGGGGWWTQASVTFLVALAGLPVARWLEFRGGDPQTSTGEPASPADLRRYSIATVLLGSVAWMLANILGNNT